jgi:PAS domain S-box-containing protein
LIGITDRPSYLATTASSAVPSGDIELPPAFEPLTTPHPGTGSRLGAHLLAGEAKLDLALASPSHAGGPRGEADMTESEHRSITVLLVEDHPGDAQLIGDLLRQSPGGEFRLECADRLGAALARLAQGGIDIVLLDLGLPDSEGPATFARVRQTVPNVPVIILTGLGDESLATRLVGEGAQDYLDKGEVGESLLRRAIRYAIERHRTEAKIRQLNERLEGRVAERTEQLEAANTELRWREHDLQEYLDSMSTMTAKVSTDGRILLVNRIGLEASGLPLEDLLRTGFLDGQWWSFDPRVQQRVRDAFCRAAAGTAVSYEEKVQAFGRVITISFSLVPNFGPDGTVAYIIAEGSDITRRVEVEEALKAANRELEAFTYSVSHDLRAPLRQIDGFSRILAESLWHELDDKGRHYVRVALARLGQQSPRAC